MLEHMRVHLDTDLGGDTDDACALAMLLGAADVELVGITTTMDGGGARARAVAHMLHLVARTDIPVHAGAARSMSTQAPVGDTTGELRYWPSTLPVVRSPAGAALDALERAVDTGATIIGIGPYTNLALLELARPRALARARVVLMGGYLQPPAPGLPQWGREMDWNVQCDVVAAEIVLAAVGDLTLVPLPPTLATWMRSADLARLRAAGELGMLLAQQSEAHAEDYGMGATGVAHAGLPDDLLNFQYDSAACAVALGWPVATLKHQRISTRQVGKSLHIHDTGEGRPARVVTAIDGTALNARWLAAVEHAAAN
jgi:purine nucleosidase